MEVVTRRDLERLEERLERGISALENRISALENGVNSIEARLAEAKRSNDLSVKLFIAFNLPTLIAVIGMPLKMVFA
jgi:predicted RNase H-like nuclease (RuvC/YqgF family)